MHRADRAPPRPRNAPTARPATSRSPQATSRQPRSAGWPRCGARPPRPDPGAPRRASPKAPATSADTEAAHATPRLGPATSAPPPPGRGGDRQERRQGRLGHLPSPARRELHQAPSHRGFRKTSNARRATGTRTRNFGAAGPWANGGLVAGATPAASGATSLLQPRDLPLDGRFSSHHRPISKSVPKGGSAITSSSLAVMTSAGTSPMVW